MTDKQLQAISAELGLARGGVATVIKLLSEGATIPFIARYRKEATGELDEVQIADIQRSAKRLDELEKRREAVLSSIREQGKMTPELERRLLAAADLNTLEDLYLPYKPKRKTRASVARERGLEPLALRLLEQRREDPHTLAAAYLGAEVPDAEAALQGARDILAEMVNEDENSRNTARHHFGRSAIISSKLARGKEEAAANYRDYFDFNEPLKKCPSHRLLAMLRAENEGLLRVIISPPAEEVLPALEKHFLKGYGDTTEQVRTAIHDAWERLLGPGIETEYRQLAKARADEEAITVFATNLRQLLLAAPLGHQRILGLDPGFRTGCKVVCLDENGNLLEHTAVYPHPPQNDALGAAKTLAHLVQHFQLDAVAIGNGTAGRETEQFCRGVDFGRKVQIFMVNEAGASIYSASEVARAEFPDHDVTVRGAVSIARRLQDPLAELVKIDPKSIGVGQYQHDVHQGQLKESLDRTVESCVNAVGVNLNTAGPQLLTYISGLGPALAQNIVEYRRQNGAFRSRAELKKVARLGDKAFEQAAGFLRIRGAANPLDNTAVHPERYALVRQMAADMGVDVEELIRQPDLRKRINLSRYVDAEVGLPTLKDIMQELAKPGLDPRGEAQAFAFANVNTIDDLYEGMVLPGIVTNVTNFGAFVDIGIKENGLVHVSQLSNTFVKNPADVVKLQQQVTVKIVQLDRARKRIQLSMKDI